MFQQKLIHNDFIVWKWKRWLREVTYTDSATRCVTESCGRAGCGSASSLTLYTFPSHVLCHYKYFHLRKAHMSSKKLLEQCQKLEKLWGHVLTGSFTQNNIPLTVLTLMFVCLCRDSAVTRRQLVHQGDWPPGETADRSHMDVRHKGKITIIYHREKHHIGNHLRENHQS